ncbi:MAG: glycosyltransferase family 39 protein, partial [Chryseosolibacter sp.]
FDSREYFEAADFFLMHGAFEVFHHIFYALPISLMALFKVIFGDAVIPFVVFQCLLSGIAALCLYRAAALLFKDSVAGLVSAVIYICWWDVIQWNTTIMTESIACSLICIVIMRLVVFKNSLEDYIVLSLTVVACLLTRPTGVLVAVGVSIYFFVRYWNLLTARPFFRVSLLICFALVAFAGTSFMFNYWDLTEQYAKGNIITYMDLMEGQRLYDKDLRLNTTGLVMPDPEWRPLYKIVYFIWHNPGHFVAAATLKICYLITGTRPYFSFLHNTYTAVWLTVIYLLFIIGLRRSDVLSVAWFSLSVIIVNCILIGVAAVDWDNRFYVPMQPGIVLLAGGGGAYALRYLTGKIRSAPPANAT